MSRHIEPTRPLAPQFCSLRPSRHRPGGSGGQGPPTGAPETGAGLTVGGAGDKEGHRSRSHSWPCFCAKGERPARPPGWALTATLCASGATSTTTGSSALSPRASSLWPAEATTTFEPQRVFAHRGTGPDYAGTDRKPPAVPGFGAQSRSCQSSCCTTRRHNASQRGQRAALWAESEAGGRDSRVAQGRASGSPDRGTYAPARCPHRTVGGVQRDCA